jgi:hypothetical protein
MVLARVSYWLCLLIGLGCWGYAAYILSWPAEQPDSLGTIRINWITACVFIWLGAATIAAGYAVWVVAANADNRSGSQLDVLEKSEPLFVAVQGDEIIVTTPDGFWGVYCKRPYSPGLKLIRSSGTDDHEMLVRTLQAANDKARELGWFV